MTIQSNRTTNQLLADYFEIDLAKLEDEKRAMLEEQRRLLEEGRR